MQTSTLQNKTLYIFLFVWVLVGMIQSYFMDLSGEEAYYFLFSQRLDWAYMDHPPMVALFTWLGYLIAPNNMGARLMMTVLNAATLYLVYNTFDRQKRDVWLFIYISIGLIGVHAGAFLIKTDVPLIFFEALFFWAYKKFLERENTTNIGLIIIAIAGMLLSKYHGILIVFFTLLSNLSLLKRKSILVILLGVVVLMLPHLYWQYTHDWTSIDFHLKSRADMGFKWKNVYNYLYSQPIVLGPIISLFLLPISLFYKSRNKFDKALKFTLIGIFVFFFINSFRVYIHKHWTSVVMLPMMILGYQYLFRTKKFRKTIKFIGIFTAVLFMIARTYLAYDFVPDAIDKNVETLHNWKQWGKELDSLAGKRNVVFINSYENASRFTYLTNRNAHCLSTYYFNNTHFDEWKVEDTLQERPAIIIDQRGNESFKRHTTAIGEVIKYKEIDHYSTYSKVRVEVGEKKYIIKAGETLQLPITITNHNLYDVSAMSGTNNHPQLKYYFLQNHNNKYFKTKKEATAIADLSLKSDESKKTTISIEAPKIVGRYQLRLGVTANWLPATINSDFISIEIVE